MPFPTLLPRRMGPGSSTLLPAQALTRSKDGLAFTRASFGPASHSHLNDSAALQQTSVATKRPGRHVSFSAVEVIEVESWTSETSGGSNGSLLACDCCERFFPRFSKCKAKQIQCFEKTTWVCSSCLQKAVSETTKLRGVRISEAIRLSKLPPTKQGEVELQSNSLHSVKPTLKHPKGKTDMGPQVSKTLRKPKTCQHQQQDNAQTLRRRSPRHAGSNEKAWHYIYSEKVHCASSACQATAQALVRVGATKNQ